MKYTEAERMGRYLDACNGVADMHCFSDEYLADELLIELGYKQNK